MKLTAIISLLALMFLGSASTAFAQEQEQKPKNLPPATKAVFGPPPEKCPCNIIGTWKAQISTTESRLYSFDADGVVKVLAASGAEKPREIATAKYEFVEEPKSVETERSQSGGAERSETGLIHSNRKE